MKNIIKIIFVSSTCLGLAACQTTNLGGLAERSTMIFSASGAKVEAKESSISVDLAKKTGMLTYDGNEYNSLVASATAGKYIGSDGAVTLDADVVWNSGTASIWKAEIIGLNGKDHLAYVVSGESTTELPSAKGLYIGSFYGVFRKKDGSGVTEGTSGSLSLSVDFVKGTVSGESTTHVDAAVTKVIPGKIVFSNGKIDNGVVTMDVATQGDLMKNMGFSGGSATGKAEAAFYATQQTGIDKPNEMLGTGSLENSDTVGVFSIGSTYHPGN